MSAVVATNIRTHELRRLRRENRKLRERLEIAETYGQAMGKVARYWSTHESDMRDRLWALRCEVMRLERERLPLHRRLLTWLMSNGNSHTW